MTTMTKLLNAFAKSYWHVIEIKADATGDILTIIPMTKQDTPADSKAEIYWYAVICPGIETIGLCKLEHVADTIDAFDLVKSDYKTHKAA